MSQPHRDTIFALSSGRPPAAIAVVRVSGPRAGEALKTLCDNIPRPRQASLGRVRDPQTREIIDEALVLWFPAPHSETGEDVAELQLHGGRAVIAAALAALARIEGLRPAEAGEFTRRAFENGKLDLTAVEGLADLVMAESEAQRRQAFRQLKGALGDRAESWRQRLIEALALVEAGIDFSDEADVPDGLLAPALGIARALKEEIAAALADGGRGERLREGLVVAISGPPNAGKSTLLNRIARREAAIVSPFAGTTRDVIEVHLDLDGWPVTLLDTAGIRETADPVEMEGVRRARERAAAADLVLWLDEAGSHAPAGPASFPAQDNGPPTWRIRSKIDLRDTPATAASRPATAQGSGLQDRPHDAGRSESLVTGSLDSGRHSPEISAEPTLNPALALKANETLATVVNERLTGRREATQNTLAAESSDREFRISAVTGEGVDTLLAAIASHAQKILSGAESVLLTRERHRRALTETQAALDRALGEPLAGREDLVAEELRVAATALGRLLGRVDVEDILDVIFRDFCIGK